MTDKYETTRKKELDRRAAGLCPKCGSAPEDGKVHCRRCLDACRMRVRNRWTRLRADGLCVDCGEAVTAGFVRCAACRQVRRMKDTGGVSRSERYRTLRAQGFCGVCKHRPATEGMSTCQHCRDLGKARRMLLRGEA